MKFLVQGNKRRTEPNLESLTFKSKSQATNGNSKLGSETLRFGIKKDYVADVLIVTFRLNYEDDFERWPLINEWANTRIVSQLCELYQPV